MIKREKDYLSKIKKKYTWGTIIWLIIMFGVFGTGYFLNKSRNNIFTVVAAVLVLPAAQYITQLFALWKFNDPDIENSKALEKMEGNYSLFHSVLVPDNKLILYFDHIIVTGSKIYCIIDNATDLSKAKEIMNKKVIAKGIPLKAIVYVDESKTKDMGNLINQIQRNIAVDNPENLNENTQLITQMMM